ncbi:MAG: exo-alpha-sialidase [Pirellulales bacterium]|nr:exo-alpha-sialidase [Pirellulales bacterium]
MSNEASFHRRQWLSSALIGSAGIALGGWKKSFGGEPKSEKTAADLRITGIERETIFSYAKNGVTWFQPRVCMVPAADGTFALMTIQTTHGSDYYGPVHWSISKNLGRSWTKPQPVPSLGRIPRDKGIEEGVCDVVPDYHPKTNTVLAIGHTVNYTQKGFFRNQPPRWPVYAIRSADGSWSPQKKLQWDDPRAADLYSCGCCQRVTLPDGDLLIPLYFGTKERPDRSVTTVRCGYDGRTVTIKQVGDEIRHPKGRGMLEPSLVAWGGRFLLTLRAEDGRGYVAVSEDGLHWAEKKPWAWDDGTPLTMSTTQQHWLPHSDGLFLVYTRKAPQNVNVFRWRAPLYVAQVDIASLRLIRATERIVLPLIGDGVKDPKNVPRMGNFGVVNASPDESWVVVGQCVPARKFRGDTLLARIEWNLPNRLAMPPGIGSRTLITAPGRSFPRRFVGGG